MKWPKIFLFLLISLASPLLYANYTLEEKVSLLFEVSPGKSSIRFVSELKDHIESLKKYNHLPNKKRVKKIFSATKSRFLKNYSLYALFPNLDDDPYSSFNCVTGTALFAIIFDELDIPYTIVELPRHVYLIAYPKTDQIGVESTDVKDGVYNWTEFSKEQAVSYLLQIGEVSESEIRYKGVDAIIENYFYSNTEHDFNGLLGMHFVNKALILFDKGKYSEALVFFRRSNEFYSSSHLNYLEGSLLSYVINETSFEDPQIIDFITRLYAISDKKSEQERIFSLFSYLVQEALLTRRDQDYLQQTENFISQNLKEEDQNKFLAVIKEQNTIYYYNQRSYKKAFAYSQEALRLNPEDRSLYTLFASCFIQHVEDIEEINDDGKLESVFNQYLNEFPLLSEEPLYMSILVIVYSYTAANYFIDNEGVMAMEYLQKLEKLIEETTFDEDLTFEVIAEVYSDAAAFYYRQKEYDKALFYIEKAIEYDGSQDFYQIQRKNIKAKMN